MKRIKRIYFAVALSLFAGNAVMAEAQIEQPAVLDGALLTVTVSDLHGLIDGVGSVAAQVSPMMNGMMLKNMIGMQLGDPQLAGVAPGKGLAVVALDATNIFAVIEVEAAQFSAYTNALSPMGMQSTYTNGFLIVGQTASQVAQGTDYAEAVKTTLLVKRSPTLRLALKPSESIAKNNDDIQGLLAMMPMMMGMGMQQDPNMTPDSIAGLTRILEGEVRILLSLAQQVDAAEVTLTPANGSIRIDKVLSPAAGSQLATFCNAPKVNKANPKLHCGLLNDGAIKLDFCISNSGAWTDLVSAEAEQLIKVMSLGEAPFVNGYVDLLKKWMGAVGGSGCEVVRLGGEDGMAVEYLLEVKDEVAALELMKTMQADMDAMGFTKLYADLGMPMTFGFNENVREHAGIKIHQLKMSMAMENVPAEQKAQFDAMGLDDFSYDVAIVDGVMACAMSKGQIEKLIDTIKNPNPAATTLKAREVYPAGAGYYCDIDIGEYMAFTASTMPAMPGNPLPQIAAMLKDAEPVTGAGFREEGRLMWSVNVPGDLLGKIGQAIMMQQMQQMQQAQPASVPMTELVPAQPVTESTAP